MGTLTQPTFDMDKFRLQIKSRLEVELTDKIKKQVRGRLKTIWKITTESFFQPYQAKKVALEKQVNKLRAELAAVKKEHDNFISKMKKEMAQKKLNV